MYIYTIYLVCFVFFSTFKYLLFYIFFSKINILYLWILGFLSEYLIKFLAILAY